MVRYAAQPIQETKPSDFLELKGSITKSVGF